MKVLGLSSISKEEGWIYYLNKYKATATLEILAQTVQVPLSFSVEISPLGQRTVEIDGIPSTLDYPVVPIKKALSAFITDMSLKGTLP